MSRFAPFFLTEVVLYRRLFPEMGPEMQKLVPECYFGYSSALENQVFFIQTDAQCRLKN